jgi:hypothetical protein
MKLALLLALVACGSSAPPVGPSHKAPAPAYQASLDDVLGFLPVDSEIVVVIDAHQIRGSQIWAALAPRVEKELGSDLKELRTACGFDPLQTVERVSIGLRSPDTDHVAGVVVVHGVGAGMLSCLRARSGSRDDHGVVITQDGERKQAAWTVIGSTLIGQLDAQASHDSLQIVVASGSPLRTSHAFMAMYDKLDHHASILGVANGRSHVFDELDGEGIRPATVDGTLNITDHLTLAGRAAFADDATAMKVDGLLHGAFTQISKLIEHAESRADGRRVEAGISMSGAQLQSLIGNF